MLYKNINLSNSNNLLRNSNSLKDTTQQKLFKSNKESLFFYQSKNSIEWKKSINQKILLSISNRDNQAEIYLKPESLGTIYIKINMKDNETTLNFISSHNEVKMYLNDHISFLRDSFKRNGLKLDKINISSSLENKEIKSTENTFYVNQLKENKNSRKKYIKKSKYQFIDVYV